MVCAKLAVREADVFLRVERAFEFDFHMDRTVIDGAENRIVPD